MRRDIFIETSNVTQFNSQIRELEDFINGSPGFALAYGQAGRGKTETAQTYYARNGGIFFRVMQGWTQCAFLRALASEFRIERARSATDFKDKIIAYLDKNPKTIFVDEADRLHVDRIEDLRDIHDTTGTPIVLIGELELHGVLGERRRIWSRVKQVCEFIPVAEEDVAILAFEAAELEVAPDACSLIVNKSDGDFRLVWTFLSGLEKLARTRDTKQVDLKMVTDVSRKSLSWRN